MKTLLCFMRMQYTIIKMCKENKTLYYYGFKSAGRYSCNPDTYGPTGTGAAPTAVSDYFQTKNSFQKKVML